MLDGYPDKVLCLAEQVLETVMDLLLENLVVLVFDLVLDLIGSVY